LWSNAATADSIVNVAGGAYQVTVTGAGGCSATATVTIANTGAPTLTLSAVNATCNGISNGSADVTTITGGTAPYTYAWNTGETTQGIVNKPAGTYTVTVTGSAGGSSTTVYAEDFDGASAANWQLNVATGVMEQILISGKLMMMKVVFSLRDVEWQTMETKHYL
jgi:hypothetical protein